jgi:hypothetical protein
MASDDARAFTLMFHGLEVSCFIMSSLDKIYFQVHILTPQQQETVHAARMAGLLLAPNLGYIIYRLKLTWEGGKGIWRR